MQSLSPCSTTTINSIDHCWLFNTWIAITWLRIFLSFSFTFSAGFVWITVCWTVAMRQDPLVASSRQMAAHFVDLSSHGWWLESHVHLLKNSSFETFATSRLPWEWTDHKWGWFKGEFRTHTWKTNVKSWLYFLHVCGRAKAYCLHTSISYLCKWREPQGGFLQYFEHKIVNWYRRGSFFCSKL